MGERSADAVNVNLVSPEQMRPKLRRMMGSSIGLGVILGLFFALLSQWWIGVLVAVLLAGPLIALAVAGMRRDQSIDGTVLHSRTFSTKTVDLADARDVAIRVHRGNGGQAMLRADGVTITLAVYTADDRGRELPIEAMSALVNGLRAADSARRHESIGPEAHAPYEAAPDAAPATRSELADLLKANLSAEAVGMPFSDRPLHRAAGYAQTGVRQGTALTGAQVRELLAPRPDPGPGPDSAPEREQGDGPQAGPDGE